jgi:hypothetical protein
MIDCRPILEQGASDKLVPHLAAQHQGGTALVLLLLQIRPILDQDARAQIVIFWYVLM